MELTFSGIRCIVIRKNTIGDVQISTVGLQTSIRISYCVRIIPVDKFVVSSPVNE